MTLDRDLFSALTTTQRTKTAEDLEVLGKASADRWRAGHDKTLTDAVVSTVKTAGLTREQVRRVVEFANTDAFLVEFRKEAGGRVVDFPGGPADPAAVLQDLGSREVPDAAGRTLDDYRMPPSREKRAGAGALEKTAAARSEEDELFKAAFARTGAGDDVPYIRPFREVEDLRTKLAGVAEHLGSDLTRAQGYVRDAFLELYGHVKAAALEGMPLGHIVRAWHTVCADKDCVKIAFEYMTPRLLKDRVLDSHEEFLASLVKTGGAGGIVDTTHPLVQSLRTFEGALKLAAEIDGLRLEAAEGAATAEAFLNRADHAMAEKRASARTAETEKTAKGVWRRTADAAERLSGPAAQKARALFDALGEGQGSLAGEVAGDIVGGAVKYAPHAAVGIGAYNVAQRAQEAAAHPVGQAVLQAIPLTNANRTAHQQRLYAAMTGVDPTQGSY